MSSKEVEILLIESNGLNTQSMISLLREWHITNPIRVVQPTDEATITEDTLVLQKSVDLRGFCKVMRETKFSWMLMDVRPSVPIPSTEDTNR